MDLTLPMVRGRLLRRYKRFLADVRLDDGTEVTATCANTGSLLGLAAPGVAVWLSISDSPTRKYPHTWEIVESEVSGAPTLVGINTGYPNKIVEQAIASGRLKDLAGYATLRREVRYGVNSRIDLLLEDPGKGACYVEIKNVHMMRTAGLAEFPDSITERGTKHLGELAAMVAAGHRAVMVYLVQRADAKRLKFAADIDPVYVAAFAEARTRGVEVLAYRCRVTPQAIELDRKIPVVAP